MARVVDQAKLPQFNGFFSFDSTILKHHVKAAKPDYNPNDPKTWPVVPFTSVYMKNGKNYDGSKLLPPFVAYERRLINLYVAMHPDRQIGVPRDDGGITKRSMYFHFFPLFYDENGRARSSASMDADQYDSWVRGVIGKVPKARTPTQDTAGPIAKNDEPYHEILGMLQESQSNTTLEDECSSLRQELAAARKQVKDAKELAKAAAEVEDKISNALRKELADEKKQRASDAARAEEELSALKERAKDQEIELQAFRTQCQQLQDEAAAAQTEAATTRAQITMIRDEMRMARDISMKRPATGPAERSVEKRIKSGPQV
jgi:hypothetical protein